MGAQGKLLNVSFFNLLWCRPWNILPLDTRTSFYQSCGDGRAFSTASQINDEYCNCRTCNSVIVYYKSPAVIYRIQNELYYNGKREIFYNLYTRVLRKDDEEDGFGPSFCAYTAYLTVFYTQGFSN